jgi:hypothetical protein
MVELKNVDLGAEDSVLHPIFPRVFVKVRRPAPTRIPLARHPSDSQFTGSIVSYLNYHICTAFTDNNRVLWGFIYVVSQLDHCRYLFNSSLRQLASSGL